MEAAQKGLGDDKGPVQNRGRKAVCGRSDRLPRLQDQGGRIHSNREKTAKLLVNGFCVKFLKEFSSSLNNEKIIVFYLHS